MSEPTEREWLEGLRHEDKFPEAGDGGRVPDVSVPPRGPLASEVELAARTIHCEVWGCAYEPGRGPMHHAGGSWWHDELLRLADRWERMAAAARVCAGVLPHE